MSKAQNEKRLSTERKLVAAIRDKMNALANAQFFKTRAAANRERSTYQQMSREDKQRTRRQKIQMLKSEIHLLLCAHGLRPHIRNPDIPRATTEESLAIRFDFDGTLYRSSANFLSAPYLSAKQAYLEALSCAESPLPPQYEPHAYRLNDSPVWQKLKLFNNFRQTRKKIVSQLAHGHIPPQAVATMNYYDFVDVLIDCSRRTGIRPFESKRSQNLKMFADCYGQEFTRIMTLLRYKPDNINHMLRQMRNGTCPDEFDFHHKTNVTNFRELEHPEEINGFPNMLLTFIHPHHRSFHFNKGYDLDKNVVFFGGYDPAYQIRRNPEKERLYLLSKGRISQHAQTR